MVATGVAMQGLLLAFPAPHLRHELVWASVSRHCVSGLMFRQAMQRDIWS